MDLLDVSREMSLLFEASYFKKTRDGYSAADRGQSSVETPGEATEAGQLVNGMPGEPEEQEDCASLGEL